MNVVKQIVEYQREQKSIFGDNKKEIDENNKKMFRLMLMIGCVSFALFLLLSLALEDYRPLSTPYFVMLMLLCTCQFFIDSILRKIPSAGMLYLGYGLCILYSIYTSAFVTPEFTSVINLFFLFQVPIVILDKSWRIALFESIFVLAYLVLALPYKEKRLVADEILNCVLFAVIALVLGEYMRKSKVDNFELKRQALIREKIDFLTGLGNRRCLYEYWAEIENSIEKLPVIGVVMIDIDKFKPFNDTYGHQAGDECLRKVSGCLLKFGAEHGMSFYRYGGEEFIGITTGYSSQELHSLCKKLNQTVFDMNIPNETGVGGVLTISIGMAVCELGDETQSKLLMSHADIALYAAKAGGRNRTVVYSREMDEISGQGISIVG